MTRTIRLRALRLILLSVAMLAVPAASFGAIAISVTIAPPLLPIYSQPFCPGAGYIWVPGYWAYGDYGYYWVPGTWELAPFIGALWTPGYWGWGSGVYLWHEGYWGPRVGFYGGIDYGFGYVGVGYFGGYWSNGSFYYNSVVNHVDRTIVRNVYSQSVTTTTTANRVSYNGGRGGISARPTAAESAAARDRRSGPTAAQMQLSRSASTNHSQLASVNHARPATLATATPRALAAHHAASTNASRAPQKTVSANRPARRPTNPANSGRHSVSNPPANRQAINHANSRVSPSRSAPYTAGRDSKAIHNPTPTHGSPRNNAAVRHAATQYHAPAQHSQPRNASAPRHSTPPASHYSARDNRAPRPSARPASHNSARDNRAAPRQAVQPHYSAPAHVSAHQPQNASHPSPAANPRKQGGHS